MADRIGGFQALDCAGFTIFDGLGVKLRRMAMLFLSDDLASRSRQFDDRYMLQANSAQASYAFIPSAAALPRPIL